MTDETYNGWKNYPTWAVNLWLANERGLYEMTLEAVQDEYQDASNCTQIRDGIWTLEEARRFNTADRLREMVEILCEQATEEAGIAADLFGYALELVDWHEIADSWLGTAREISDYDYA